MSKARDAYRKEIDDIVHEVENKAKDRFPKYDVFLDDSYDSFETKVVVARDVDRDDEYIEDALAEFCIDMDEKCEYLTFIPRIRYKTCK